MTEKSHPWLISSSQILSFVVELDPDRAPGTSYFFENLHEEIALETGKRGLSDQSVRSVIPYLRTFRERDQGIVTCRSDLRDVLQNLEPFTECDKSIPAVIFSMITQESRLSTVKDGAFKPV